jgi:hypothetical protein
MEKTGRAKGSLTFWDSKIVTHKTACFISSSAKLGLLNSNLKMFWKGYFSQAPDAHASRRCFPVAVIVRHAVQGKE